MGKRLSKAETIELKKIHEQINTLTKRAIEILTSDTEGSANSSLSKRMEKESNSVIDAPIEIYTDGACSGNPGPAGSGVVIMQDGKVIHEISKSLGKATNNIAELTAIKIGLQYISPQHNTQVTVYTDSTYAIGILTKNWKAKANIELVSSIRELIKLFKKISIVHVKGHNGDFGNERADSLAVKGVSA